RLIAAAVAIDDERGGAFGERPAESIHTRHQDGDGLDDSRAAPFPQLHTGIQCCVRHHFRRFIGEFAAQVVHESRHRPLRSKRERYSFSAIASSVYLPRPVRGVFRSGTTMLPSSPRWAQPANKSVPEKTSDDFPRSCGPETKMSSRL